MQCPDLGHKIVQTRNVGQNKTSYSKGRTLTPCLAHFTTG